MSALTIANIDPETEAGLRRLAERNGRTLEAEIADLLAKAAASVAPPVEDPKAKGLGSEIVAMFAKHGGFDLPERQRWPVPEPIDFDMPDYER